MAIDIGGTYKFNRSFAKIERIERGIVFWRDIKLRRKNIRRVPLWFFEKHAIEHPVKNRRVRDQHI